MPAILVLEIELATFFQEYLFLPERRTEKQAVVIQT